MAKWLVFLVAFASALLSIGFAKECNHRDFGNGGTVCVCSEALGCDDLKLTIPTKKGVITSFVTSKAGDRFRHHEYQFTKEVDDSKHQFNVTVQVNRTKRYQKIIGFGGSFTDSTGINLASLPTSLQSRLIKDYFGSDDGIGYSAARIPIGGTDFSVRPYTYDDIPDSDTLNRFALQHEDFEYKFPYIRMANQVSNHTIKYLASNWNPPAWMKNWETNHLIGGSPSAIEGSGKYYKVYAKYLVKFVQEYARNNVTIWGLTIQNEPHTGGDSDYDVSSSYWFNTLAFNSTLERDFIKFDLGPQLHNAGLGDLKVMIYDDNVILDCYRSKQCHDNLVPFASTVLKDKEAAKFTSGVAFHWYNNREADLSALDQLAEMFPDKFFISSEACEQWWNHTHHVSLGNWDTFDRYADDIIKVLNRHTSGWIDWNMALNLEGGPNWQRGNVDAPIIVNQASQEYYKQPFFYALGHFSKFLVPDSVRIAHQAQNINEKDILVTVFERPDHSLVLTLLNKLNEPIQVKVHDPLNGFVAVQVGAKSLQSFIWY